MVALVVRTGRASLWTTSLVGAPFVPLEWDDGPPWQFRLHVGEDPRGRHYEVTGVLVRGEERVGLGTPILVLGAGLVVFPGKVARLDDAGAFPWVAHLRGAGSLRVPLKQADQFLDELLQFPWVGLQAFARGSRGAAR